MRQMTQFDADMLHREMREGGLDIVVSAIANRQIDDTLALPGALASIHRVLREEGLDVLVDGFLNTCLKTYVRNFGGPLPGDLRPAFEAAYCRATKLRFMPLATRLRPLTA